MGCFGPKQRLGCCGKGVGRGAGLLGCGRFALSFFSISNSYFQTYLNSKQISNSNQDLNPNTQKQCTSMYATVNSYISLIN
jgi:hypothetical protein